QGVATSTKWGSDGSAVGTEDPFRVSQRRWSACGVSPSCLATRETEKVAVSATARAHNPGGIRPRGVRRLCRHCAKCWVKWVSASSAWAGGNGGITSSMREQIVDATIALCMLHCHAGLPDDRVLCHQTNKTARRRSALT